MYSFTNDWFGDNRFHLGKHSNYLAHQAANILEIGAYEGRSTTWIADNLLLHSDSKLITIEPFKLDDSTTPVTPEVETRFYFNIVQCKNFSKIKHIRLLTKEVLPTLTERFDLIYIDGSHLVEDVFHDIFHSWTLLKDGGLLWIDNYSWINPSGLAGPKVAVDRFLTNISGKYIMVHSAWALGLVKEQVVIDLNTALVINLNHRPDRWEKIKKKFQGVNLNLYRMQAITKGIELKDGLNACGASHQKAIQIAKHLNLKRITVLEDDATIELPVEQFNKKLNEIMEWLDNHEDEWDIFFGGMMSPFKINEVKNNNLNLVYVKSYVTHFMIYNRKVYDRILSFDCRSGTIDGYYYNNNNYKLITITPMISRQDIDKSDIWDGVQRLSYNFDQADRLNANFIKITKGDYQIPDDFKNLIDNLFFGCDLQVTSYDVGNGGRGLFLEFLALYIQYIKPNMWVWSDKRIYDTTSPKFMLTHVNIHS